MKTGTRVQFSDSSVKGKDYYHKLKRNSNVSVNEEKENDTFDTDELSYQNGKILEKITTYKNQDQPIGYIIEISNKNSAPEKNQSTNFKCAFIIVNKNGLRG